MAFSPRGRTRPEIIRQHNADPRHTAPPPPLCGIGKDLPLESERNGIHHPNQHTHRQTHRGPIYQRPSHKRHCRSDIHRVVQHVERETGDAGRHEDAKVVAEVGAGDTERIDRGDDKQLTDGDENPGEGLDEGMGEGEEVGLVCEGVLEADSSVQGPIEQVA